MPKTKKRNTKTRRTVKHKPLKGWRKLVNGARFIPAIVIALSATVLAWQPQTMQSPTRGVLAYATNTSPSGLLSATNTQRINFGASALTSNSLLASAAQTKAEDMVARDYWSHVTPDGKQPWTFITAAGYSYTSAGENLAYGFMSSGDTVTGWMNSPSHKDNMLSTAFSEVGFGIANSPNFVGDGPQTIVVAMYGSPQVAGATTTYTPPAQTTPKPAPAPVAVAPEPTPVAETAKSQEEPIAVSPTSQEPTKNITTATPTNIGRIQLLTNGNAVWSATALILIVSAIGVFWAVHRGFHIRKYILAGEHFISKHVYLDLTVLAIVYLGFVLLSTSGAVR